MFDNFVGLALQGLSPFYLRDIPKHHSAYDSLPSSQREQNFTDFSSVFRNAIHYRSHNTNELYVAVLKIESGTAPIPVRFCSITLK